MEWLWCVVAISVVYLMVGFIATQFWPTPPGVVSYCKTILIRPIKIITAIFEFVGLALSLLTSINPIPQ